MGSIIIAFPKIEEGRHLAGLLKSRGTEVTHVCDTGAQVLALTEHADNGVIICGYRLGDMTHIELNEMLPDNFEMILAVSAAKWDMCLDGVLKVEIPFNISDLAHTIEMVFSKTEARRKKGGKESGGRTKEQQEIVEKAQRLLMERNGMERREAYRYIQKQSMNSGNSMLEVAGTILKSDYY